MEKLTSDKRIIGIGVLVVKDRKLLLGFQTRDYEEPCWALPGGKLDSLETVSASAIREVEEETTLLVDNVRPITFFEDVCNGYHVISLQVRVDYVSGRPRVVEPEKCREWNWFDVSALPSNLTINLQRLKKKGFLETGIGAVG